MDCSRSFDRFFTTLAIITLTGLVTATLGCDSGTQEPAAPEPDRAEYGSADSSAGSRAEDSAQAGSNSSMGSSRSGAIDPSRFPTDLPEGVTAEIPHNFPSDISIFPGAEPAQGRGVDLDGSPMSAVQLVTNASAGEVFDFYQNDLQKNGWTIDENRDIGSNTGIQATKGDCKATLLVAPGEDGGSDVYVVTECR